MLDGTEDLVRKGLGNAAMMSGVFPKLQIQVRQHRFEQADSTTILSTAEAISASAQNWTPHFKVSTCHSYCEVESLTALRI